MKPHFLILAVAALAGCNDPGFRGVQGVRVAQASEVGACRLVENIDMQPGVYGPILAERGVKYARNKMLDQAGKDGANTVVFTEHVAGSQVVNITGKAYSC